MNQSQDDVRAARIEKLKSVAFQATTAIPIGEIEDEGGLPKGAVYDFEDPEEVDRLGADFASVQMSLFPLCSALTTTSIDQISVCLEMARHLYFYGEGNLPGAQAKVIQLTKCFADIAREDSAYCSQLKLEFAGFVASTDEVNSNLVVKASRQEKRLNDQSAGLDEVREMLDQFIGRQQANLPPFDVDQKPELGFKVSPKVAFSLLHQEATEKLDTAIDQTIDMAMKLLVKTELIQNAMMPYVPSLMDQWSQITFNDYLQVERLIKRVDVLCEQKAVRSTELQLILS